MLECNFNIHTIFFTLTIDHIWIKCFFPLVQVSHKFFNTTFIVERFRNLFFPTIIC